jgi:hypothetical protein
MAECNLGIMCACAPSLNHFFKRFFGENRAATGGFSQNRILVAKGSNSQATSELSASSRPLQMSSRWPENLQPAAAYEWQQKSNFSDAKSDSIGRPPPRAAIIHPSSKAEPRSFLIGATVDDEDHYAEGW